MSGGANENSKYKHVSSLECWKMRPLKSEEVLILDRIGKNMEQIF